MQGFALFGGPALGGYVGKLGGRRMAAWMAAGLCLLAAVVTLIWQPDETAMLQRRASTAELTDEELARHQETHREVHAACLRLVLLHDLTPTSMHAR